MSDPKNTDDPDAQQPEITFQTGDGTSSISPNSIEGIFLLALQKNDPAERNAWLDEVCGDDQEQRLRVTALLRAYDDAGSFMETPASGGPPNDEISLSFLKPVDKENCLGTIGPYEVLEVIGRGGMGLVLRAIDPKLNRVVAVKVLIPELAANPNARRRFLREAQAAAAISHPHVVTIHAVEEAIDGEQSTPPYLVMECVVGQSLQQKMDAVGPLRLAEIVRISRQISDGLAAAHRQGVIHRDIKPANILLENGVERVKITDFGLARAIDDITVTRTGEVSGTPQYMSPEQANGERVDHCSDLFSLGCVMYAMCTGHSPFRGDSIAHVIKRVTQDTPRPVIEQNAEIPNWLIQIIDCLLDKSVKRRFQSAEGVSAILEQHLARMQQPADSGSHTLINQQVPATPVEPASAVFEAAPSIPETSPPTTNKIKVPGWLRSIGRILIALSAAIILMMLYGSRHSIGVGPTESAIVFLMGGWPILMGAFLCRRQMTREALLAVLFLGLGPLGLVLFLFVSDRLEPADPADVPPPISRYLIGSWCMAAGGMILFCLLAWLVLVAFDVFDPSPAIRKNVQSIVAACIGAASVFIMIGMLLRKEIFGTETWTSLFKFSGLTILGPLGLWYWLSVKQNSSTKGSLPEERQATPQPEKTSLEPARAVSVPNPDAPGTQRSEKTDGSNDACAPAVGTICLRMFLSAAATFACGFFIVEYPLYDQLATFTSAGFVFIVFATTIVTLIRIAAAPQGRSGNTFRFAGRTASYCFAGWLVLPFILEAARVGADQRWRSDAIILTAIVGIAVILTTLLAHRRIKPRDAEQEVPSWLLTGIPTPFAWFFPPLDADQSIHGRVGSYLIRGAVFFWVLPLLIMVIGIILGEGDLMEAGGPAWTIATPFCALAAAIGYALRYIIDKKQAEHAPLLLSRFFLGATFIGILGSVAFSWHEQREQDNLQQTEWLAKAGRETFPQMLSDNGDRRNPEPPTLTNVASTEDGSSQSNSMNIAAPNPKTQSQTIIMSAQPGKGERAGTLQVTIEDDGMRLVVRRKSAFGGYVPGSEQQVDNVGLSRVQLHPGDYELGVQDRHFGWDFKFRTTDVTVKDGSLEEFNIQRDLETLPRGASGNSFRWDGEVIRPTEFRSWNENHATAINMLLTARGKNVPTEDLVSHVRDHIKWLKKIHGNHVYPDAVPESLDDIFDPLPNFIVPGDEEGTLRLAPPPRAAVRVAVNGLGLNMTLTPIDENSDVARRHLGGFIKNSSAVYRLPSGKYEITVSDRFANWSRFDSNNFQAKNLTKQTLTLTLEAGDSEEITFRRDLQFLVDFDTASVKLDENEVLRFCWGNISQGGFALPAYTCNEAQSKCVQHLLKALIDGTPDVTEAELQEATGQTMESLIPGPRRESELARLIKPGDLPKTWRLAPLRE